MEKVATFRPAPHIVLMRPDPIEEVTASAGGVLLPDEVQPHIVPRQGTVIAFGKESDRAQDLGPRVLFSAYAGTKIEVNGEELMWMTDDNIIAGI